MSTTQFTILTEDGESVITLVIPGDPKSPYIARDDHPNFKAIVGCALEGDFDEIASLFDIADTIATKFQRLSERVTVEADAVYFDGVEVNSALTQQIIAVLNSGATDASWTALVNFFEKVQTNPSEESRNALYVWIKAHQERGGLTISEDGDIVGYKGVQADDEYGYRSISGGKEKVLVNDEAFTGRIPNPVGATVEMARDLVDPSSTRYCSVGLHVGTWGYASSFGPITLEVRVNPRDVVAVPQDAGGQKVRTCRYTVVGPVEEQYAVAVLVLAEEPEDDYLEPGTRVKISDHRGFGTVLDEDEPDASHVQIEQGYIPVRTDRGAVGGYWPSSLTEVVEATDDLDVSLPAASAPHGKGGPHSKAAEGRGRNPHQDTLGRFSSGRPGSRRDSSTGRFA